MIDAWADQELGRGGLQIPSHQKILPEENMNSGRKREACQFQELNLQEERGN